MFPIPDITLSTSAKGFEQTKNARACSQVNLHTNSEAAPIVVIESNVLWLGLVPRIRALILDREKEKEEDTERRRSGGEVSASTHKTRKDDGAPID